LYARLEETSELCAFEIESGLGFGARARACPRLAAPTPLWAAAFDRRVLDNRWELCAQQSISEQPDLSRVEKYQNQELSGKVAKVPLSKLWPVWDRRFRLYFRFRTFQERSDGTCSLSTIAIDARAHSPLRNIRLYERLEEMSELCAFEVDLSVLGFGGARWGRPEPSASQP